jgi:hypothetical protein
LFLLLKLVLKLNYLGLEYLIEGDIKGLNERGEPRWHDRENRMDSFSSCFNGLGFMKSDGIEYEESLIVS